MDENKKRLTEGATAKGRWLKRLWHTDGNKLNS